MLGNERAGVRGRSEVPHSSGSTWGGAKVPRHAARTQIWSAASKKNRPEVLIWTGLFGRKVAAFCAECSEAWNFSSHHEDVTSTDPVKPSKREASLQSKHRKPSELMAPRRHPFGVYQNEGALESLETGESFPPGYQTDYPYNLCRLGWQGLPD